MSKRIDYNLTNATTGYFGINTTSPSTRFQVSGSNEILSSFLSESLSSNQNNSIAIGKALTLNNSLEIRYHHLSDGNTSNNLQIGTYNNSSSFLTIRNDGNVGIGTTSPNQKLDVNGTINASTFTGANVSVTNVTTGTINVSSGITSGSSQFFSLFITGGSLNANFNSNTIGSIITTAGNVGIGTTSPGYKFVVAGDINFTGNLYKNDTIFTSGADLSNGATVGGHLLPSTSGSYNLGSTNLVWNNLYLSGNVGIGTTSPGYKLHVVGDIFASGEITSSSDVRMKTNIESIDMSEEKIEKIKNIRGVLFDRQNEVKQNLNHKHMGFVAQELEEAIPEVVYTDPDTGYKSVAYGNMTAILLEYIKHLNNKIEKMETTVNNLQNKNS